MQVCAYITPYVNKSIVASLVTIEYLYLYYIISSHNNVVLIAVILGEKKKSVRYQN